VTAAAVSARPGAGGSAVRRALGRVALVAAAVAAVGLIWTGYKAMGAATGDVWPGTSRPLPVPTDDTTLPPFLDILGRFGEPQRTGDPAPLWQYLVDASLFTFREAFVGFLAGIVIGLALAVLMLRSHWLERGLLPWVIVSQTVPLIALAPVVVAWGNQLPFGSSPGSPGSRWGTTGPGW
jgi:NitT/TauT family transport system permease protein